MATIVKAFKKEDRIQQLKDACDSIKENAADFIGNEEFARSWKVSIVFECNSFPVVQLERESYPSAVIKKMFSE